MILLDDDMCPDGHEGRINRQVLKEIDYFKISTICSLKFIFHMTDLRILRKMMVISGLHLIKILRPEGKM